MTRYFILSLLVICLICVFQACAAPADDPAEDAWKSVKDTFQKNYDSVKPSLEKFAEDTKDFFSKAVDSISKEAQKIVPKTD